MSEGRARTRQSGADKSVSIEVIEAVAASRDEDPATLPPLHEHVNPEALDSLFRQTPHGRERSGQVSFEYYGFVVSVSYDGETTIRLVDKS
jgi:hypothetical protein